MIWKMTIILIANLYVVLLMKALWSLIDLHWGFVIIRHRSLPLAIKYIENRVINCIMDVLIKCTNVNIWLHNVQMQCFKAVMKYKIEGDMKSDIPNWRLVLF